MGLKSFRGLGMKVPEIAFVLPTISAMNPSFARKFAKTFDQDPDRKSRKEVKKVEGTIFLPIDFPPLYID